MRIIKVVVDELPMNCNQCLYFDADSYSSCLLTRQKGRGNWITYSRVVTDTRPDWCPLLSINPPGEWSYKRGLKSLKLLDLLQELTDSESEE